MIFLRTLTEDGRKASLELRNDFIGAETTGDKKDLKTVCFLDTETTGLDNTMDEITQIALMLISFDKKTGCLHEKLDYYESYNETSIEIPEKIVEITGITDAKIKGHSIDWSVVESLLERSDLIVAHNASFDRGFVQKYPEIAECSKNKIWACSKDCIDWRESEGYLSSRQENIAIQNGFFYPSHSASADVNALANILCFNSVVRKDTVYFKLLLENIKSKFFRVDAVKAPFATKDTLKANGFRWDVPAKVWYKKVPQSEAEALDKFLSEEIYLSGKNLSTLTHIPVKERF